MGLYVAVVGAVNMDIHGQSDGALIARDSNPGVIRLAPGGVGRNIAHNLALLGADVRMLTALGDDLWAASLEQSCRDAGIDLTESLRVPGGRSSSYLYITGSDGDMALAVCDAAIVDAVTPDWLARKLDFLNRAALVVADCNLSAAAIAFLAERVTAPLFVDPVSTTKARKLLPVLGRVHTLKPNAQEAEALTGCADPAEAAAALVRLGVARVFVSAGQDGMFCADRSGAACRVPCCTARLANANGGGDAAMAALCKAYLDGRDLADCARYAMAAGAIAVESPETVAPGLSDAAVRARMMG